jgi:hypothetical protein
MCRVTDKDYRLDIDGNIVGPFCCQHPVGRYVRQATKHTLTAAAWIEISVASLQNTFV